MEPARQSESSAKLSVNPEAPPLIPIHFKKWINDNRHLLKPPVGNRLVWENREFMVTVVGGPNSRQDFHVNSGEEFFYQLEGNIILRILESWYPDSKSTAPGKPKDIEIQEGDIFLLPPNIPHSPQRPAGTVGLVLERKRLPHELDGFLWLCSHCGTELHREFFHLTDIVNQLPPVFKRFYENEAYCVCKKCGTRAQKN